MISLIKMNLKLLMRNKGFLFFLLITPVVSSFILSLKVDHSVYNEDANLSRIVELETCKKKAVYMGNTSSFIVKVYDASGSELSEYVLNSMANSGMFSVCRCDVKGMTSEEIVTQAKKDAFDDRAGVLLYLKESFDEAVMSREWQKGMKIYDVSEDERQELFETELIGVLNRIKQVQIKIGEDSSSVIKMLKKIEEEIPEKKIVSLAGKDEVALNHKQTNQWTQIGYAFAILSLGFLFCGVCVAHTVIEEQNNRVFTRVMLTKINSRDYFISKFWVTFIISVMQTLVLVVCLLAVRRFDFGIPIGKFIVVVFLLGLIFSTLSLLLGVIMGDVMSSNYAVFAIWCVSALLSGLYFPLDNTTATLKTLSYLMPQKWFMDASKLLLTGDNKACYMLLYVTVAYLVVIVSVGGVGLKIKRHE